MAFRYLCPFLLASAGGFCFWEGVFLTMRNEILLLLSIPLIYGGVLLSLKLFGSRGLTCFTVLATIAANIEVLILVDAFGLEQTLGNILFASTFLVTDILSELYGKKAATNAVNIGIASSLGFVVLSQLWLLYQPSANDWVFEAMTTIFSNTPRMIFASVAVYAVCQRFDVWLYHWWWDWSERKFGDRRRFLWLRNNGSTLVSQLLNTVLFNLAAFGGTYDGATLVSIIGGGYLVFIVTSLADTPFIYWARRLKVKEPV